jgi:serine/threonine-protein kinase
MISDLAPNIRCGDYELLAFIGKGGMAQVWSARHLISGELVAVKTLLPLYAADPVLQERLAREGDSQKTLHHPNILRAHGTFRLNGSIFMVMDLVDGESLERYMLRRRNIPVPEVRGIAQAVLSGLQHAHESNIVHRDVKPSNILLSRTGRILLSDFGIALLRNAIRLTRIGGIGTPCYMSPEQIIGRDIGPLSDIYSVGCVLYELLTGFPPFHAEGPGANEIVREAHRFQVPEPLLPNRPEIPPALAIAVLRALEKKPAARFQSCAEFAAALGVSIQRQHAAGPLPDSFPLALSPAQGGSDIQSPRMVTPADARGAQRPSGPRVSPPLSGPGVTIARPSGGRPSGRHSDTASSRVVSAIERHPQLTGAIAIGGAVLLAVLAIARWEMLHPAPLPNRPQPAAVSSAPPVDEKNPAQSGAIAASASASEGQGAPPAASQVEGRDGSQGIPDLSAPVSGAINQFNQLKDAFDRSRTDAQPAAAPAVNRPPPLAPPPGALSNTSGVLQWTGTKGDSVEVSGITASKGFLTGDQLPGVPVRMWVENDDGTITQMPSDADGYERFTLRAASGHARIHWQTLGPGQTK